MCLISPVLSYSSHLEGQFITSFRKRGAISQISVLQRSTLVVYTLVASSFLPAFPRARASCASGNSLFIPNTSCVLIAPLVAIRILLRRKWLVKLQTEILIKTFSFGINIVVTKRYIQLYIIIANSVILLHLQVVSISEDFVNTQNCLHKRPTRIMKSY